jgi:hypothetical protein
MRVSYELWASARLRCRVRCTVEPSMHCVPLRGDPICMACFESSVENQEEAAGDGHRDS